MNEIEGIESTEREWEKSLKEIELKFRKKSYWRRVGEFNIVKWKLPMIILNKFYIWDIFFLYFVFSLNGK